MYKSISKPSMYILSPIYMSNLRSMYNYKDMTNQLRKYHTHYKNSYRM